MATGRSQHFNPNPILDAPISNGKKGKNRRNTEHKNNDLVVIHRPPFLVNALIEKISVFVRVLSTNYALYCYPKRFTALLTFYCSPNPLQDQRYLIEGFPKHF